MGYYTRYRLSVVNEQHSQYDDFMKAVAKTAGGELYFDDGWLVSDILTGDQLKWYCHSQDMASLSKQFPDLIFLLEGHGEEEGDVWKKYYLNGQEQVCKAKLTFDDFDPMKLKPVQELARN